MFRFVVFGLVIFSSLTHSSGVNSSSSTPDMFQAIASQIKRNPTLGHCLVGFTLFGGSDILAQEIELSKKRNSKLLKQFALVEIDLQRCLASSVIGVGVAGCVYPFAYTQIDRIWAGKDLASVVKKSIVEICTVGVFVNSLSIAARGILAGHTMIQVKSHVVDEMPIIFLNDVRVWFPYNLVAFSLIPAHIRPSTTALMEALWQTYISVRSNAYQNASPPSNDSCSGKKTKDSFKSGDWNNDVRVPVIG